LIIICENTDYYLSKIKLALTCCIKIIFQQWNWFADQWETLNLFNKYYLHQSLLTIEHHQHNAYALFWSSRANDEHHWCDVNEWVEDEYCYLAEKFNQDEEYTWEIEQAASTLWVQRT